MIRPANGTPSSGFVIAGVSDAVDGLLARRFDLRTELGAYLDPLADKALLVSIYVTLGDLGKLPAWLAILVVSRDIMIVGGGRAVLAARPIRSRSGRSMCRKAQHGRTDRPRGLVLGSRGFTFGRSARA